MTEIEMRVTQPQARGRQGCCGQQTLRGRPGPPGPLEGARPRWIRPRPPP